MTRCVKELVCLIFLAWTPPALGQGYPFSQRGSASRGVAFTRIAIEYGRAVARGRQLFGQVAPRDSNQHPGRGAATRSAFARYRLVSGGSGLACDYTL